jgi:hypothetical protein
MDFDHRPGELKSFGLGAASGRNREAIVAEIAKCDLVCANCHRVRTKVRASVGVTKRARKAVVGLV